MVDKAFSFCAVLHRTLNRHVFEVFLHDVLFLAFVMFLMSSFGFALVLFFYVSVFTL